MKNNTERDAEGWTALHWVAKMGAMSILKGIPISAENQNEVHPPSGKTPLHLAVSRGLAEITKFFVQSGADTLIPDRKGQTVSD